MIKRLLSERWVSVTDIAQHLAISKETIYRMIARKEIPTYRVGKLWKFKISEVDAHFLRK